MSAADGAAAPSPGTLSPAARPIARRWWLLPALVVLVIGVVVVAALFATGTLRLGGSNPTNPPYETFSQAESVAQGGAGSVSGGPWFAAFGVGAATPTSVLEPTTNLSELLATLNCTIVWPGGVPANVGVPSTPTTAAAGAAAYWVFGLKNASNGLLLESVSLGVASSVLKASGARCSEAVAYLAPFPSGVVDSPAIVATANEHGGSSFLAAHANATKVFGAYGGAQLGIFGSTSPMWYVEYTSCSLPAYAGEMGADFNATLGGTSGAVINVTTGPTNCELTLPTGIGLAVHAVPSAAAARKAI